MESDIHSRDPCGQIPGCFIHASAVREIAKIAEKQGPEEVFAGETLEATSEAIRVESPCTDYQPPKLLARDVIASGRCSDTFDWHLEACARQLNFPSETRQAFVADGA